VALKKHKIQFIGTPALVVIWLVGALGDRLWLAQDQQIPSWDPTNHLTGSLNYLNALQNFQFFSEEWWHKFWMLSSKYPPLTYIVTAPFQQIFGTGPDQALLVNLLFSAILLRSVYGLGKYLFSPQVGTLAAFLCVIFPRLYIVRLNYLTDYPLTALVTACFLCLTVWRVQKRKPTGLLVALKFGFWFGLAMMVKQSVLFFLFFPLLWLFSTLLWQRAWWQIAQLLCGLLLSSFIFLPWYSTNWIFLFGAQQRGIVSAAIEEGDPPLNTIEAWTYYWNDLPSAVSFPLLVFGLLGLLLYWSSLFFRYLKKINFPNQGNNSRIKDESQTINDTPALIRRETSELTTQDSSLVATSSVYTQLFQQAALNDSSNSVAKIYPYATFRWLAIFFFGSYLIWSAIVNKDTRYIMPYLPVLSVILAYGMIMLPRGFRIAGWSAIFCAFLLMCLNLFPLGDKMVTNLTKALSPNAQHYPYLGFKFPHAQIIDEIIQTEPQLQATVGVLPRIPDINHNNLNYYGALRNFQVYGREVGVRNQFVTQDARALSWFLSKTGEQGIKKESQKMLVETVAQSPYFQVKKSWNLPDGSLLNLYHLTQPPIQVKPLNQSQTQVSLDAVTIPQKNPAGVPVPVTYQWSGPWEELQSGIVLLTWHKEVNSQKYSDLVQLNKQRWLHDHGIGMGNLYSGRLRGKQTQGSFQVTEATAMLPPANIPEGTYVLEATYLNRKTGANYSIPVPSVKLQIAANAPIIPAPELDLVTQLRSLAADLPQGRKALDRIFEQVGRINQYDPVQDYTTQAELALEYRLQQEPKERDWAYALAFSKVLQRDVDGAIAALRKVVFLDSQNPYAHAYLAFVYLYQLRGKDAQYAIQPALKLNPNIPEVKAISGAAALLQGNVFKAWSLLKGIKL
jgi:4-amino-4-deoxy-L-arabinose transferase-like glycosyltransferase